MKNSSPTQKQTFLTIDFYLQCFFFLLILIAGISSFFSGYFVLLGLYLLLPITLYNSIGLTYHIFKGSYSKEVEMWRKIHAISAIVYLIVFVLVIIVFDNAANQNELTFIIFWGMPPIFLAAYFFITLKDWRAMRKIDK